MYDVTNRESFQKIDNWLNELETYSTNHDLIKMLVGNKVCVEFIEGDGDGEHIPNPGKIPFPNYCISF